MRDLDDDYDELMYELEAAVRDESADRGERMQAVRLKIEDLLRTDGAGLKAAAARPTPWSACFELTSLCSTARI